MLVVVEDMLLEVAVVAMAKVDGEQLAAQVPYNRPSSNQHVAKFGAAMGNVGQAALQATVGDGAAQQGGWQLSVIGIDPELRHKGA